MPDELPPLGPPPAGPMPPPRAGLFGKPKEIPPPVDVGGIQKDINSLNTRLLVSEERYNDLRRKLQLIESNMLAQHKKLIGDIKMLTGEQSELKRGIEAVENKIILLIKELQLMAKREDVELLKRYIELWEPSKFATFDYVDKTIKERSQGTDE